MLREARALAPAGWHGESYPGVSSFNSSVTLQPELLSVPDRWRGDLKKWLLLCSFRKVASSVLLEAKTFGDG